MKINKLGLYQEQITIFINDLINRIENHNIDNLYNTIINYKL